MNIQKYKIEKFEFKPLIVALIILLIDQISKILVTVFIPIWTLPTHPDEVHILGDFFTFIHVRNLGAGFSFAADTTGLIRFLILIFIPLVMMVFLAYVILGGYKNIEFPPIFKYFFALIFAGGVGNLIDRIFRPEGVVDFLNVKLYGFLGFEYWPTFNIADSVVVIGIACIVIYCIIDSVRALLKNKRKYENNNS